MTQYFGAHGRFCASHPWEVIVTIVTLTVCALSMSVLSGGKVNTVCGIQKPCQPKQSGYEVSLCGVKIVCMALLKSTIHSVYVTVKVTTFV